MPVYGWRGWGGESREISVRTCVLLVYLDIEGLSLAGLDLVSDSNALGAEDVGHRRNLGPHHARAVGAQVHVVLEEADEGRPVGVVLDSLNLSHNNLPLARRPLKVNNAVHPLVAASDTPDSQLSLQ